jgi:hypothetical protein
MIIKRRGSKSFTDDGPDNSRAICSECFNEYDTIVKTVPYEKDPSHYRYCNNCKSIIPKNMTRLESITEPLGSLAGKSPTFEVAVKRRRIKRTNSFEPTEEPVPLLNGKPDKDLENLLVQHNGILVSVSDDNVGENEEY